MNSGAAAPSNRMLDVYVPSRLASSAKGTGETMALKSRLWLGVLLGGLVGASLLGSTQRASADDDFPLKKWMQANMGAKKDDAAALVPAFKKVASFQPDPAWTEWKTMSEKGAQLAAEGKLAGPDGASQVCKDCHAKYKSDYKAKYRTRPLP